MTGLPTRNIDEGFLSAVCQDKGEDPLLISEFLSTSFPGFMLGAFGTIKIKYVKPCPQEGKGMCVEIYLCANLVHPSLSILFYVYGEDGTETGLEGYEFGHTENEIRVEKVRKGGRRD